MLGQAITCFNKFKLFKLLKFCRNLAFFYSISLAGGLYYDHSMVQRYINVYNADINVSRVGLLFEKELNHYSYFLRSRMQLRRLKVHDSNLIQFQANIKDLNSKITEWLQLEPRTLKSSSQHVTNSVTLTL
jgi:hypothetical protein